MDAVQDCEITLHGELAVPAPQLDRDYDGEPLAASRRNRWLGAITVAGEILRFNPDAKLANRLLVTDELFEEPPDTTQRTLARIINASINPALPDGSTPTFSSPRPRRVDTCSSAEGYFSRTFRSMSEQGVTGRPGLPSLIRGHDLIVAGTDEVIAVQKRQAQRSTLSLVDVIVNGIPYPAGSLFRVNVPNAPPVGLRKNSILHAGAIARIAFMRLSTFALTLEEREGQLPPEENTGLERWPSVAAMKVAAQEELVQLKE